MSFNWSLKRIGGYFYLYSFKYKPVLHRKKKEKEKRFDWKYHGKFGSVRANKFIKKLPKEEQKKLYSQFKKKTEELRALENIAKELETQEPFLKQKNLLYKIEDIKEQHNVLRKFHNKLLTVAKIQLDKEIKEKDENNEYN